MVVVRWNDDCLSYLAELSIQCIIMSMEPEQVVLCKTSVEMSKELL
jgi:hypothetical protein